MTASISAYQELDETPAKQQVVASGAARSHVAEIEEIAGPQWDAIAAGFDGVCQEQLYTFAQKRWPDVKFEPLIFRIGGAVVGGVLMMIQPLPLRLGAIAVSKWGPILKDTNAEDRNDVYAAIIDALVARYDGERKLLMSILPRASRGPGNAEFDYLIARGFARNSQIDFPDRYVVNLRLDDEALRKSFAQKWRYHLNKSMKQDLSFAHAPASDMPAFNTLYRAMTGRKGFADHSAYDDTVVDLMAMENDALRPELFFVRENDELVAGAIIFKAGDVAVYLYGATNDKALPLRAGYFLHWHIIRWLRDNTSANWYDLGGTEGNQGLHQFKKGMVGDAGFIAPVPPVANYSTHFIPTLTGNLAFSAREVAISIRKLKEAVQYRLGGAA